ncbi:MAG: alpha/beta fold hydrolase [Opitutae bacterium]|nr:alpha/beta fold hydrolase [Opitutae bacterium]
MMGAFPKHWLISGKGLLLTYLLVLLASHMVRWGQPGKAPYIEGQAFLQVEEMRGTMPTGGYISMAYLDWVPPESPDAPVLVLLHGSPMASASLLSTARALQGNFRLIIPDLPGFGGSTLRVEDHSILAHAYYLDQLLRHLGVEKCHLAGYSMGGGVALEYAHAFPGKLKSLLLISSIGVQELELLGNYTINHAIHALQLGALWFLQECIPHFGWMDNTLLNVPYARNFFDTDQRPLRERLMAIEIPTLILHAEDDNLVPVQTAQEHHRIVPHSELQLLEEGHLFIITRPDITAPPIIDFVTRAERGEAPKKSQATPERIAASLAPFSFEKIRALGIGFTVLVLLLALATLVSEDLTCIGAGLLAAKGVIGFIPATLACLIGIFIGDILLYLAGRLLGRKGAQKAPLRWVISEADLTRSAQWFERRGMLLIFLTRFFPGTRLPTYFTAGLLGVGILRFSFFFLLAATVWTPLLVGLSAWLGGQMLAWFEIYQDYALLGLIGVILSLFFVIKFMVPLFSHRGRRLLLGKWIRFSHWEFWPLWKFYPPVVLYVIWLALKHRNPVWFTATNPGMPRSGLVLESKHRILQALQSSVAPFALLPKELDRREKFRQFKDLQKRSEFKYPVILKPDVGERGLGVVVTKTDQDAKAYFKKSRDDIIVQEYVEGLEYGIFYYRFPEDETGHIYSITDKRFIAVSGDGEKTVEQLILDDPRAVAMAPFFIKKHAGKLFDVLPPKTCLVLAEIGTHSRGCLFLDGPRLTTPELTAAIARISKAYPGFYFGRYDVRVPSVQHLQRGEGIRVIELNGITSEATSIYDPRNSLYEAYRILFRQWDLASEIARQNRKSGVEPAPLRQVIGQYMDYKKHKKIEV